MSYTFIYREDFLTARKQQLKEFQAEAEIARAQGVWVTIIDAGEDIVCDSCNGNCTGDWIAFDPERMEPDCERCVPDWVQYPLPVLKTAECQCGSKDLIFSYQVTKEHRVENASFKSLRYSTDWEECETTDVQLYCGQCGTHYFVPDDCDWAQ